MESEVSVAKGDGERRIQEEKDKHGEKITSEIKQAKDSEKKCG